ncbi:MAG TPA: hypothetical protein VFA24_06155 [Gaiellaceae bacterium]|nr:hypothetical protein [Gaiellaceae bacterium]
MTETAVERTSGTGRWLRQRRLKVALGIAVLEGILVALEKDFTRWTLIIVSAPIIAFYLFAGRSLESDTGRQLSWIAAAAQAFAVILTVVALVIGAFVLIVAGVFAAIALIMLLGERERPRRT